MPEQSWPEEKAALIERLQKASAEALASCEELSQRDGEGGWQEDADREWVSHLIYEEVKGWLSGTDGR